MQSRNLIATINRLMVCTVILASTFSAEAQLKPQWSVNLSRVTMSAIRFADVDGNGVKDIVFATMGPVGNPTSEGLCHVYDTDGNPLPGWPVTVNNPITGASVAVGDIDNNGDMELVVQGWFQVHVWNHDGTNYPGWPKATGTGNSISPTLADLDGDGDLEIICPIGSAMHVWHHDGTEATGWPQSSSESFQTAAVGDVDDDGDLEIIAGNGRPNFPDQVPFQIYMWSSNGEIEPGFPINNLGSIRGPISLGDIDNDGEIEIVARAGDLIQVFNSEGQSEPGWPVDPGGPIRNSSTAIGDVDGDGYMEIFAGGFDLFGYHHDGTTMCGFPVDLPTNCYIISGLIIASIDGDSSSPEILVKISNAVAAVDADGSLITGFPFSQSDDNQSATYSPSPAVGDVDGDGDVEYAFMSVSGRLAFFDEEAEPHNESVACWPMSEHDAYNTSLLSPSSDCPWDLDQSGAVGTGDLLALFSQWGTDGPADFDGSGAVGTGDLLILFANWGPCE